MDRPYNGGGAESERNPLLGHVGGHGSSINNPGGLLESSLETSTPTASVTYNSVEIQPQKVYRRRWYCLFIYTMLCFIFGLAQSAITPIAHAMQTAFDWNDADIAVIGSLPALVFILSIAFCTWFLENRGMRMATLLGAFALTMGAGIRCITPDPKWCRWTFNTGQLVLGLNGPIVYGAPTTFSNNWFPSNQRTIATSAAAIGNALGLGVGSVLAPYLVQIRYRKHHNASHHATNMTTTAPLIGTTEFGLALAIFIILFIYFPSKPPSAPTASASSDRVQFRRGILALARRHRFWLLAVMFALTNGSLSGFGGLLDVDLDAAKIPKDQLVTGYLTLGSLGGAVVACIIISSLADRLRQYIKHILIALFIAATGAFLWFALIIEGVAPASYVSLFVSYILASLLVLGCTPVFLELSCDATYPISEGLTTGTLNILSNAISLSFYAVQMAPNIGTRWMNWVMVGSTALCVPLLIPFSPSAGRMQVDNNIRIQESDKTDSYGATA